MSESLQTLFNCNIRAGSELSTENVPVSRIDSLQQPARGCKLAEGVMFQPGTIMNSLSIYMYTYLFFLVCQATPQKQFL